MTNWRKLIKGLIKCSSCMVFIGALAWCYIVQERCGTVNFNDGDIATFGLFAIGIVMAYIVGYIEAE